MKLAFLTIVAIPAVLAASSAESDSPQKMFPWANSLPKLFGAEQLVDVEAHCEGCQPDYCYEDKGTEPDYFCYK